MRNILCNQSDFDHLILKLLILQVKGLTTAAYATKASKRAQISNATKEPEFIKNA